jgi:hypothetical protein
MTSGGGGSAARPAMPNRDGTFTVAVPPPGHDGSGAVKEWITSNVCPWPHRSS